MNQECLFCKIGQGEIDTEFVYEDKDFVAFPDINPKAPVHILVVPKRHLAASVADLTESDIEMAGKMLLVAKKVAEGQGISESGYKTLFNVRRGGGQAIDHIHLHVLGGKDFLQKLSLGTV